MSRRRSTVDLAMFQPDQPGNLGAAMRLSVCFCVTLHVIEPCGFPFDDRRLKRAGMDYLAEATWHRHADFERFCQNVRQQQRRIILLTTRAKRTHHRFSFKRGDLLLVGSESGGVPVAVHERADERVRIAMAEGARSLNVVVAAAIGLAEALRQVGGLDSTGQQ